MITSVSSVSGVQVVAGTSEAVAGIVLYSLRRQTPQNAAHNLQKIL